MIDLQQVWRTFSVGGEEVHALAGIDLRIERGEYVSLMGPSGSGKSTLLNVLGLLDRPTSGRYLLDGREVTGLDDVMKAQVRREKIGFVFQSFHLVPRLSAAQNIELPLVLAGMAAGRRRELVQGQLAAFGLQDRARHLPDQLSGGQRQRTAIARATVTRPEVILADEPTGNLDRHTGEEVVRVLEQLHQEGITLIVVTHDPVVGGRAHRRLHMEDGRITLDERAP